MLECGDYVVMGTKLDKDSEFAVVVATHGLSYVTIMPLSNNDSHLWFKTPTINIKKLTNLEKVLYLD